MTLGTQRGQELKGSRNLEARTDVEAIEASCLLACSLWLTRLPPIDRTRNTRREVAPPTIGWALTQQSLNKMLYRLAYSPIYSTGAPFSQMTGIKSARTDPQIALYCCFSLFPTNNTFISIIRLLTPNSH